MTQSAMSLTEVVTRLLRAARGVDRVTVGNLVDAIGRSSMAAVLMVPALLLVSPLSGIPGASTVGGAVIALVAGQIVLKRDKVWLPDVLRNRTVPGPALRRALVWLRRPARWFDGFAPARPKGGTDAWWSPAIALLCLALGLTLPMMELIPFSSSIVATLITVLALAMLTGRVRLAIMAIATGALAIGLSFWLM
ncbi:MAG: exopolysaccharide biosynthesis protein [Paracoccaceae bacterium]